ncbi:unnamed protein product [Phytophthora lilii]|uniref:Unnamed protein product n=1 Tax=Phytophthora lilii TaxID=2077276 RepID=A0A9W6UES6_9STRA|nr:unnamed protein product [Phytophthora lilii]
MKCFVSTCVYAGTAFNPHKWLVYVSCIPETLSELSFPAISALKSMNVSEEVRAVMIPFRIEMLTQILVLLQQEQGRPQGQFMVHEQSLKRLDPIIFSWLYSSMTRTSVLSQAFPSVFASLILLVGVVVAFTLPVGKKHLLFKDSAVPQSIVSITPDHMGNAETGEFSFGIKRDERMLAEPLLEKNTAAA